MDQLKTLANALGLDKVLSSGEEFEIQCRSTLPESPRPLAFVYPESPADIIQTVNFAREHKLKLWTVSRGRNWGYGSQVPIEEGMLVVNLQRMNKILEINNELAYAVVEPGVSFRQLRDELEKNYPDLWCDCIDGPPEGSVIGNALDRGVGVTSHGDHFGNLCGMEVVLANGSVIKTGGGSASCPTWPTHKWGVGPYIEGLFSQGNFGIVTKAGVWLIRKPECFKSFTFDLKDANNLEWLVDTIRELSLKGILQSFTHIVNEIVSIAVVSQYPRDLVGRVSSLNTEQVQQLKQTLKLSSWSFGGGLVGTPAQVAESIRVLKKTFRPYGRLTIMDDQNAERISKLLAFFEKLGPQSKVRKILERTFQKMTGYSQELIEASPQIHSLLKGKPSDYFVRHAYFKSRQQKPVISNPDCDEVGLIWFAPLVPMTGKHVSRAIALCQPLHKKYDFDFYLALLVPNPRSIIFLQCIFFDKKNPQEAARAQQLYHELNDVMKSANYLPYRVNLMGMKNLFSDNPDYHEFLMAMKKAVDSENILSPGKYGL